MGHVEKKHNSEHIIKRRLAFICWIAGFMTLYYMVFTQFYKGKQESFPFLRVRFADAVNAAEEGHFELLEPYPCVIINLESKVIYSNHQQYKEGDLINLHSISTERGGDEIEKQFVSPLVKGETQIGTLMIHITELNETERIFQWFPAVIFLGILVAYTVKLYGYIDQQVLNPINKLNSIVAEILNKQYQKKIQFDNKNELGRLFQKLDLLRDELQNSSMQAKKYQENEKILLACISHDLKTPISTIIGYAEGIRDGLVKKPSDIERYIEIILSKAVLLTKLINDILEHSNAELDELSLNRKEVYSKNLIVDILEKLASDVLGSGISFMVDEIPDILLDIAPDRVFQVFQNLVGNSLKYTEKNGWIHVSFELCKDFLAVEISDNGQGIEAMDIPFVFDRFYRGEKARTQKEIGGSGLGLSIVKNIIERHGGRVECDSVLGRGTSIRFLLPKA